LAYRRGRGTVTVELARLQDFAERVDGDLYGSNGQKGIVEEYQERSMREETVKEQGDRSSKRLVMLCAIFSCVNPLTKLIEYLHSIWK
jgi:hypothetical protein